MQKQGGLFTAAPLVALAGWVLPGLGYLLIGQRTRGIVIGVTILMLFSGGMLLGGARVIDVPGYDDAGQPVMVDGAGRKLDASTGRGEWALVQRPMSEIAAKPWFIGQVLTGPVCLASAKWSVSLAREGVARSHARILDIGMLYTAIAGMLNLLAIIDCAHRAQRSTG